MKGIRFLIFLLFICPILQGQNIHDGKLFVTGVICDRDSIQPLPDGICRLGKKVWGVDQQGRFSLEVNVGDTLLFSHVGYVSMQVVISDTLSENDFLIGVFLVRDTILLSEVLIFPRFLVGKYKPQAYQLNAQNNFRQALHAATQPVKEMDREMNRKMVLEDFARKVEMKGMVDVKLGVGTQSLMALRGLLRTRRKVEKGQVISVEEIDLLMKIFYVEKREKRDN